MINYGVILGTEWDGSRQVAVWPSLCKYDQNYVAAQMDVRNLNFSECSAYHVPQDSETRNSEELLDSFGCVIEYVTDERVTVIGSVIPLDGTFRSVFEQLLQP